MKGTKKPLRGAKKYSLAPLYCTTQDCDNEFFVSLCTTPATRKCFECLYGKPKNAPKNMTAKEVRWTLERVKTRKVKVAA